MKQYAAQSDHETFWNEDSEDLLKVFGSDAQKGLSAETVAARQNQFGPNSLKVKDKRHPFLIFLTQFKSPVSLILLGATLISFFVGNVTDALIILSIVIASGLLSFYQEYNAGNAVAHLLGFVEVKASVLRDGELIEIPVHEIVPGDIVHLSVGDVVPADARILTTDSLAVDESTLTGETFPVEKQTAPLAADTGLSGRDNILWMGTHVTSGAGTALVIHTGKATEFGKISRRLATKEPETEFESGVRHFGYLLMEITGTMVLIILFVNLLLERPVMDSFLFALALAVGITPQLLPAIISVNLSKGAKTMADRHVIVKKLSSIENFGSMNILCSDKTGTITMGTVELQESVSGDGTPDEFIHLIAALTASLEEGYKNPIDQAIAAWRSPDLSGYAKNGEIPYNFVNRRLSVACDTPIDSPFGGKRIVAVKGAVKNVLQISTKFRLPDGKIVPIDEYRDTILQHYQEYSDQGYRTLGVAWRETEPDTEIQDNDLIFAGFLTFADPLKPGIRETVSALSALGVELKIITGDNQLIAASIAHQLGLRNEQVLTGELIAHMTESALVNQSVKTSVFAEIEPNQKERIVRALKKANNVVGYMGDGINDAAAIQSADVGISVNTGADVAKEAAAIVLLRQDLAVLTEGIRAGRRTFANTLKYVFMATSANFGNMFSMAGASLFLPFLPLEPSQILLTNLSTDFPEMQIASDQVDKDMITRPRRWDIAFIKKFMVVFGLLSSIFDYITFAVLLFGFNADKTMFQTAWFIESIISAMLIVFVIRTKLPVWKSSRPGKNLVIATLVVTALILILPYTTFGTLLNFAPLPLPVLLSLFGVIALYLISGEIVKYFFYRKVKL